MGPQLRRRAGRRHATTHRLSLLAAVATVALVAPASAAATPPDHAASDRYVVTLGDSYISGEGARWAGNTAAGAAALPDTVDALGADAYHDTPTGESIPGCHRAEESVADVDQGRLQGVNLACSGAQTSTFFSGATFKPGIDFYEDAAGHQGQALMLQEFAEDHTVTDVVVSIGGNDFGFSHIVTSCAVAFVLTVNNPQPCSQDPGITSILSPGNVESVTQDIVTAYGNVAEAMANAGYDTRDYSIVVMTYPSPIPPGDLIRYPETVQARLLTNGCPMFDVDATWANAHVQPTINGAVRDAVARSGLGNIEVVDMVKAFRGHRVCEEGVSTMTESPLDSWQAPGAVDEMEWVNRVYAGFPAPWQLQESVHPNYWGTLAERSCIRQSVRGHGARSGTCVIAGTGLTDWGEPVMKLVR